MEIKEYIILNAGTPTDLVKKVNEAIKEGWQPLGGVSSMGLAHSYGSSSQYYYQAMVKYN